MRSLRLSVAAQADIAEILDWTERTFGEVASDRYEALIVDGLHALQVTEDATGARPVASRPNVWSRHLSTVPSTSDGAKVKRPRHVLIYRVDGDVVTVGRVVHERMDRDRQIDPWIWGS